MKTAYYHLGVESESDNFITTILHFDQNRLIKDSSETARIMAETNPNLFNTLAAGVQYYHGNVYRYDITQISVQKNRLGVNVLKPRKSQKETILSFSFNFNKIS